MVKSSSIELTGADILLLSRYFLDGPEKCFCEDKMLYCMDARCVNVVESG